MNIPMTAHFIGGCAIGYSSKTGVIDPYHRLYGYPGLHVVDGSSLSANLGREPVACPSPPGERAMSMWPKGPPPAAAAGTGYQRLARFRRAILRLPATRPGAYGTHRCPGFEIRTA